MLTKYSVFGCVDHFRKLTWWVWKIQYMGAQFLEKVCIANILFFLYLKKKKKSNLIPCIPSNRLIYSEIMKVTFICECTSMKKKIIRPKLKKWLFTPHLFFVWNVLCWKVAHLAQSSKQRKGGFLCLFVWGAVIIAPILRSNTISSSSVQDAVKRWMLMAEQ